MIVAYRCICKFKKNYNPRYIQVYQVSEIYLWCQERGCQGEAHGDNDRHGNGYEQHRCHTVTLDGGNKRPVK